MPIIRLLLLITGNLRIFSASMCRTALARSSSSRQQWMPGIITSRAVAPRASNLSCANPSDNVAVSHHADQLVVLSKRNGAYIMLTHQFREFGDRGVRTDQSTPLCITSLTFMADLRCWSLSTLDEKPLLLSSAIERIGSCGTRPQGRRGRGRSGHCWQSKLRRSVSPFRLRLRRQGQILGRQARRQAGHLTSTEIPKRTVQRSP
jgi:hypothetical protein